MTPTSGSLDKLLLAAITVCAFGRGIFHDWVQLDDPVHVTDNPHFFPVTVASLVDFWWRPYEFLFIPVSYMLFGLESVVSRIMTGGGSCAPIRPELFHAVSVGLHFGNVLVVRRLLGRLSTAPWMAAVGAAVFAVHPLQAESVAWISEQRGLLAALLSLVAVERFMRLLDEPRERSPWRADALFPLFLFWLAMLAKPQAVTIPLIALALGIHAGRHSVKTVALALGPWFALAAVVAMVTRLYQPVDPAIAPVPLVTRPMIAADAIAWYATKVIFPVRLCMGYGRSPAAILADPWTPLVASTAAGVLAAIFFLLPFRGARLPMAIFLSALLPVLGFVSFAFQSQSTVADRYAYVAMLGPATAITLSLGRVRVSGGVGASWGWASRQWLRPAALMGLVGLAMITARQVSTWQNTGTVALQACRIMPTVAPSWVLLGAHYINLKDSRQAVAASRQGLELDPKNFQGWINLGCGLAMAGQPDEAERAFITARDLGSSPRQWIEVESNLGRVLLDSQRNSEAAAAFAAVLDCSPRHMAARQGLGVALTRIGALQEAIQTFRSMLDDQPGNASAWVGLGNAFLLANKPREAVTCYGRALSLDPNDPATLANRARARIAAGDIEAARGDVQSLRQRRYHVDEDVAAAVDGPEAGKP